MIQLTANDLAPLTQHINDRYDGDVKGLCRHLENAIYMLFYLEEEAFSQQDVQKVVYALKNLKDGLNGTSAKLCS